MPSQCGVVLATKCGVEVEVDVAVEGGDIAGEVGYFHLFGESLVDVFLGRGVEETERCSVNCSYSANDSGGDVVVAAECGNGFNYLAVVFERDNIFVACLNKGVGSCAHCCGDFIKSAALESGRHRYG